MTQTIRRVPTKIIAAAVESTMRNCGCPTDVTIYEDEEWGGVNEIYDIIEIVLPENVNPYVVEEILMDDIGELLEHDDEITVTDPLVPSVAVFLKKEESPASIVDVARDILRTLKMTDAMREWQLPVVISETVYALDYVCSISKVRSDSATRQVYLVCVPVHWIYDGSEEEKEEVLEVLMSKEQILRNALAASDSAQYNPKLTVARAPGEECKAEILVWVEW